MKQFVVGLLGMFIYQQGQALVLDYEHKKVRNVCGEQREVTPLEESIVRGHCEPFAQGVGQIRVKSSEGYVYEGTGVLIAPHVVLTAAHVVRDCVEKKSVCEFHLSLPTKYAGEVQIKAPIGQTHIMSPYEELNQRIRSLEEINARLTAVEGPSASASQDEILSKNYKEIATYKTAQGAYDLAIVELVGEIKLTDYLQIYSGNIKDKFGNNPSAFGVAVNQIKENRTGSHLRQFPLAGRHLGVFQMDGTFKETENPLVASFLLPQDYEEKCQMIDHQTKGVYPDRFVYDLRLSSTPFLKAIVQPGDSGGPLIAKVNGEYYIVGVAQHINYSQCYDVEKQKLVPNQNFFNVWTPTFNHMDWIRHKLVDLRAQDYQKKLFPNKT